MNRQYHYADWLLTAAIAVALCTGFLGITRHRAATADRAAVLEGPAPGATLALNGVDWESYRTSLVFVMQVGCHWCEASAGFYRDLLRSRTPGSFHPIAVLPQSPAMSRQFLSGLGVPIADVRQASLPALGVSGTPTLILVGPGGKILGSWTGQLSAHWQTAVYQAVGTHRR